MRERFPRLTNQLYFLTLAAINTLHRWLPFALRDPTLGSAWQVQAQLAVHTPNALVIPTIALRA